MGIIKKLCRILILLMICSGGLFLYARYVEPNRLIVKSIDVKTQMDIEDCKVVFFTDTHLGKYYAEEQITKIVTKINERNADVVIFGGDLLDNYARDKDMLSLSYLQEQLSLINAPAGKFAVFGNHDYGGGARRIYEEFMESCGFTVLNDESLELAEFNIRIIGYDDYLLGWTDPSLYQISSDQFNIIAAHEPVIATLIESKSDNFMFSGHTHGGQVFIPFLTAQLLPEGSDKFVKGLYNQNEIGTDTSLQLFTSSGIGLTKYPFRLWNTPEIAEVNFSSEK